MVFIHLKDFNMHSLKNVAMGLLHCYNIYFINVKCIYIHVVLLYKH